MTPVLAIVVGLNHWFQKMINGDSGGTTWVLMGIMVVAISFIWISQKYMVLNHYSRPNNERRGNEYFHEAVVPL